MKTWIPLWCIAVFVTNAALGDARQQAALTTEAAVIGGSVAVQTALARADVAIAKSVLNDRLLKGELGEAIRDQTVGRYLHRSGKWLNVSPRLGPQGLDHISVQLDESGHPRRLMVDETKFGTSKLLTTKSGRVQMSREYVAERLTGLAKRFDTIRTQTEIPKAKTPAGLSSKRIVRVPLSDSESVAFWRPAEGAGRWQYDGPTESLPKALTQLKNLSELFQAGAEGRMDFPKRVFQVKLDGNALNVNIFDATRVEATGGNLNKLPVKAKIALPLARTAWVSEAIQVKLANELRRQMPYLETGEVRQLAQDIQNSARTAQEALARRSFSQFAIAESAKSAGMAVLIAVPIEIAVQLLGDAPMDWWRVAGIATVAGGSAAIGSATGNIATYVLLRTELGYSASAATAKILGLRSVSRFTSAAGGAIGGGATAILFAYGGYWLGYYDLQTANRTAFAGAAGAGAGTAAYLGTLGLISTYATAGTGVAISSLSGASATSASLAWLGGGSLASGGLGVTGGTILLSTGTGIVVIGVTAAVLYGFHVYDEHQDNIRLKKTLDYLSGKKTFFISPTHSDFR